jgi:Mg2+-importing ATPase
MRMPASWASPLEALLAELGAAPGGLSADEAERRLSRYGPNRPAGPRGAGALGLLLNQFRSPLVLLLVFAMTVSLFVGYTTDALIVLGSALLGFAQEYRASRAVAALLAVIQTKVTVLRDGRALELPEEALVSGDVVLLEAGAAIPADARILESRDLCVDESTLTGES